MLEDKILKLIENEDKRNPLTDSEIAKLVNTTREYITQFRTEKNINNSRQRKEKILYEDIKKLIIGDKNISDRYLCKKLSLLGYDISRYSASQIKKNIIKKMFPMNVETVESASENLTEVKPLINKNVKEIKNKEIVSPVNKENNEKKNYLRKIIGYHGSLKNAISQAEAAVLYPPHGLHTLLLGPSGVGKSFFAESMYKFAISSSHFGKNAPFIIFNCADYSENPQLLLSQLFGYSKGAFTGANTDKVGLVEKANNGVLFLDEVHRLPSEGQEILFYLLDKGKYRRLGETENSRIANVMIIAATTEDPKSALLLTFRRRIPMIIELPSINNRSINERYILIKNFFSQESYRVGKEITVRYEVIRSLLLYNCPGNIGQLRSDIQVACARGFFNSLSHNSSDVVIDIKDLPDHVPLGILSVEDRGGVSEDIINEDLVINPNDAVTEELKDDRYMLPDRIYNNIEEKYYKLEKQGLSKDQINKIIWSKMEFNLNKFAKNIETNVFFPKEELKNIIDEKILNVVENVTNIAKQYIENIQENFYYCIAMHLNSTYERLKQGRIIKNPESDYIKKQYYNEYRIAKLLTKEINKSLNIELPEDEIGFIAMYLKTFSSTDQNVRRVAVIVLSHGHVACGMADVANTLLGTNLAVGIEMSLDESPRSLLKRTIEVVKKVHEGKGCLLLVDMGSLVTFGEIITKETGVPTRVIGRVDTVMVLEAVRRALIANSNLYEIAKALDGDKVYVGKVQGVKKYIKTIITICITGEGTALKIKKYLEDIFSNSNMSLNIIPIGIMNRKSAQNEIINISKENNIAAIVGTIDPELETIPFISFQDILKESGKLRLKDLLGVESVNPLISVIDEELIQIRDDIFVKSDLIDEMCKLLITKGKVKEGYTMSVYKREMMGGTLLEGIFGIPHGLSEFVEQPSLAIFKLNNPILWDYDCKVDVVIMLALKESDVKIVEKLFDTISRAEVIDRLKHADSSKEISDILLKM
ncbi:sigma 54-interacting transcriptional regulator [Clostridium saccharobutylicum]|uniref:Transcriptional regulatory protein LevR n=1 Tax=Clostridium saccharobutylicum DSM 13864 TaxID=1345695 RepID=U5MTL2_CLOSA|nr:sigma 54-interacting transcriptional regulator [Clostridium saccharobutylicum]AGX42797.1 transcriptional regulatory protein LevR [Clostridium saccharobutylicum DSM 13864]AQR90094.1 transcriptional regulatory protein QseF [Clostridium saccharobutylicum]AQR99999.1 transcriptional regulatory protein QseF [Clostridium saccharobutylicum]AQS09785.1 transcriptional regulatory protein QseF [Clostridium saccharobutylicum]AQS13983.1 transcriptional regulatory protein QseF [Clostridium saccharobutylic